MRLVPQPRSAQPMRGEQVGGHAIGVSHGKTLPFHRVEPTGAQAAEAVGALPFALNLGAIRLWLDLEQHVVAGIEKDWMRIA